MIIFNKSTSDIHYIFHKSQITSLIDKEILELLFANLHLCIDKVYIDKSTSDIFHKNQIRKKKINK